MKYRLIQLIEKSEINRSTFFTVTQKTGDAYDIISAPWIANNFPLSDYAFEDLRDDSITEEQVNALSKFMSFSVVDSAICQGGERDENGNKARLDMMTIANK